MHCNPLGGRSHIRHASRSGCPFRALAREERKARNHALMAVAGGLWALVGGAWLVRTAPEIQAWAASTPGLIFGIALPVVVFAVGFFLGKGR